MSNKEDYSWIWWVIGIVLLLSWASSGNDSSGDYNNDDEYCEWYDADPTQWTEMVCE